MDQFVQTEAEEVLVAAPAAQLERRAVNAVVCPGTPRSSPALPATGGPASAASSGRCSAPSSSPRSPSCRPAAKAAAPAVELLRLRQLVEELRADVSKVEPQRDAASRMLALERSLAESYVSPQQFDAVDRARRELQAKFEKLPARYDELQAHSVKELAGEVCDFCEAEADGAGFVRSYDICEDCWCKFSDFLG